MVQVSKHVPDADFCWCLVVSGSMLLCGGKSNNGGSDFVVALHSDSMDCQHTLLPDSSVNSLLSMQGEVWGTLGYSSVAVWGKADRGGRDQA